MVSPDSEAMKLCSPLAKQKICSESPTPGALQQHLFYGEYDPFKYAPIFESDFVQVTKKGEVLNIHNQVTVVTVGVTSTSPNFSLPNVMLLARPINDLREMECNCQVSTDRCPMELTRLFPLSFVNISIHDVYNRRLRLKLANGRAFYLQLYVHPECENEVFERWMKLVTLLHTNPEEVYGYEAVTPEIECILEQASAETSATELSEWQLEPPTMSPGMREYYEASHASSKRSDKSKKSKSDKSKKSEKPEDCSERTQSRKSRKSGSSKMGESEGETGSIPDFSQEQEPWPPVEPPQKKKKTRGPIGFNFFKGDKVSKEKSPEEGQKLGPVSPPTPDYEEEPKTEWEEKGDRKRADEGTGRQKEKSKMDKGEKERKRQKDKEEKEREKIEKQKERERQLKEKQEKRQRERDNRKQKGKDKGTDKERRQREKEERQREKEAKQREKEEKKQREQEDRKQRGMEDKKGKEKRSREKEDKKKQAKAKGEKDVNESVREVKGGKAV